jgi:hypothetical protein
VLVINHVSDIDDDDDDNAPIFAPSLDRPEPASLPPLLVLPSRAGPPLRALLLPGAHNNDSNTSSPTITMVITPPGSEATQLHHRLTALAASSGLPDLALSALDHMPSGFPGEVDGPTLPSVLGAVDALRRLGKGRRALALLEGLPHALGRDPRAMAVHMELFVSAFWLLTP